MLKLKRQYFGYLMWSTNSLEKTLMLGNIESKKRIGQQRMRWLGGFTDSMDVSLSKLQEMVKGSGGWCAAVHWVAKSQTWLSDWATAAYGEITKPRYEGRTKGFIWRWCFVLFLFGAKAEWRRGGERREGASGLEWTPWGQWQRAINIQTLSPEARYAFLLKKWECSAL